MISMIQRPFRELLLQKYRGRFQRQLRGSWKGWETLKRFRFRRPKKLLVINTAWSLRKLRGLIIEVGGKRNYKYLVMAVLY